MVKIRLARGGAKKNPFYSIVATDSRKRRDSGYIERIGFFNPVARGQEVRLQLEEDRLSHWISQGAQISDRVKQLVKEYRDPSIREKQLAKHAAKADVNAKKIAAIGIRVSNPFTYSNPNRCNFLNFFFFINPNTNIFGITMCINVKF